MNEPFELELLGGGWERCYRRQRPELDALPWGTLRARSYSAEVLRVAREHWTIAAFQEHVTAAACGELLRLLVACRAPLDLIAYATRFPLDELVHVELCARICDELGGAAHAPHDPRAVAPPADATTPALLAAAELAIRFAVGEAYSVPILVATMRATIHPLVRGVLEIIARDEGPHGSFGWVFLDWAAPRLDPAWRPRLVATAATAIGELETIIAPLADAPETGAGAELGWLEPARYVELARRAIDHQVRAPLAARQLAA